MGKYRGYRTENTFRLRLRLRSLLKLSREGLVVEEDPGIVELVVPRSLQVTHRRNEIVQFLVSDEGDQCRVGPGRVGAIGGIVVVFSAP